MPYRDRLNGWAVVRLLPNFQRVVVARFRNPSDAEGYCQSLVRLIPNANFLVVFDPPDEVLKQIESPRIHSSHVDPHVDA